MPQKTIDSTIRTLDITLEAMSTVRAQIVEGELGPALAAAVTLIGNASGRLIIVGVGKSGHIGRKLAATFSSTGTPAYFVHPTEASHGDLGMVGSDDVIMALSWSGETPELANIINYAKRFDVALIALTAGPDSALAKAARLTIPLPRIQEACPHGLAPTTSTVVQMVIGDALALALLEEKGFSANDFGVFHPGGKLGASLKFVRDLMHAGEHMPLLETGARMSDAIMEMTSHGFGVVGIVDARGDLTGIITDGDLRRHMGGGMLERSVDEVMSRNPKVVDQGTIAGQALEIMQGRKISVLFVVEDGKPVGIVHMLDLLRAGVA